MIQGSDLFFVLFNNLAIFIALIAIYSFLFVRYRNSKWYIRQTIFGLSFGLFAIGCMFAKIPVFTGVIVDQRNAIIALSGAFGGPLSAILSSILAAAFRAYLGGDGVLAGIIGVNLAALSGILLYYKKNSFVSVKNAVYSSIFATIIILPGFLFVGTFQTGFHLLKKMSLPYGFAICLGIFISGLLLYREEQRTHTELLYRESENKYRVLFESFPMGVIITDSSGKIIETNNLAESVWGAQKSEKKNIDIHLEQWVLFHEDGSILPTNESPGVLALKENKKYENIEVSIKGATNDLAWINVTAAPIPLENYGVAIVYNNISLRKKAEAQLKSVLSEKTILLQELYHRTKNNMQVIIALLHTQMEYIHDEKALNILQETQSRIHSMALVHQKLYQSRDLSHINLKEYIRDLTNWLVKSYQISEKQVAVVFHMMDVFVLIDTAIPCGLILHEIISNTLKYAFVDERSGKISCSLQQSTDGEIKLKVKDNGVGIAPNFDFRQNGLFGIKTVFSLGEVQLRGQVSFVQKHGIQFTLNFKDEYYSKRV